MKRVLALGLLSTVLGSCELGPPVRACPALVVGEWTWFGVIGPPGSAQPGEIVRLYHPGDEEWGDAWRATPSGSFALRAAGRVGARGSPTAVLVLEGSGARYTVRPRPSEATIEYAPGSRPVMQTGPNEMTFTGWLSPTRATTPIAGAWVADWTTGEVEWIEHPILGVPFSVSMRGGQHHCMTIYTEHVDDGTGGAWWPHGGGCLCHHCTLADEEAGTCHEYPLPQDPYGPHMACGCNPTPDSDPSHPPREPLPVDERHDPPPAPPRGGPPPPERGDDIPAAEPSDAGPPPRPDAWFEQPDAWSPHDLGPPS
jgi:hypothetical protein